MKTVFILLLIPSVLLGQETRYFAPYFQKMTTERTENKRRYSFNESQTTIEDFRNDTLVEKGVVYGTTNIDQVNEFAWYSISLGAEFNYRGYFDTIKGHFDFYDKGKIKIQIKINGKNIRYSQVWNSEGAEILKNGNGHNQYRVNNSDESTYEIYKDSTLVLKYGIRDIKNDTIYHTSHKQAAPTEGLQSFYQKLAETLRYPGIARLLGKEGRVYVQFIVDKDGALTEFKPLTKEGHNFESRVIKKLSSFPKWSPAMYDYKPVKTKFILPIKFELTK